MLIGVMADTHDRLPTMRAALERFAELDVAAVVHAGDVVAPFAARLLAEAGRPLYVVYGNNDGERAGLRAVLPQIADGPLRFELGGRRILLHHFIDWCSAADVAAADVVITGHTHEVLVERRDGVLLLNPGECCGWLTDRPTVATIDLESNEVRIIEVRP